MKKELLVITGPIASGKTKIARDIANYLARGGNVRWALTDELKGEWESLKPAIDNGPHSVIIIDEVSYSEIDTVANFLSHEYSELPRYIIILSQDRQVTDYIKEHQAANAVNKALITIEKSTL